MPWFVVYETATGIQRGETVDPDQVPGGSKNPLALPAGWAIKPFPARPAKSTMWNPATLDFVPKPAPPSRKDGILIQLESFFDDFDVAWLPPGIRVAIRNAMRREIPE